MSDTSCQNMAAKIETRIDEFEVYVHYGFDKMSSMSIKIDKLFEMFASATNTIIVS